MGREIVMYKDKYFWIQGSTVEFWYTIYFRILANRSDNFEWEVEFAKEIKEFIDHQWIEGTLYLFDDYLSDQDRLNRFVSTIKEVNKYIQDLADKNDKDFLRINELDFCVDKCTILSEMDMFYKFFAHPEEVPDGFYYQSMSEKWVKL